jgi:hypothetical protein
MMLLKPPSETVQCNRPIKIEIGHPPAAKVPKKTRDPHNKDDYL